MHGVRDTVAGLEPRRELWRREQHRTPVVAPRPETSLLEVIGASIFQGHLPESLGINETGLVSGRVNGAACRVDDDPQVLDAEVVAQVPHAVDDFRVPLPAEVVALVQFGSADEQVARDLGEVDHVECDLPLLAGPVGRDHLNTSAGARHNVLSNRLHHVLVRGGCTIPKVLLNESVCVGSAGGDGAEESLGLPDLEPVRFLKRTGVRKAEILEFEVRGVVLDRDLHGCSRAVSTNGVA